MESITEMSMVIASALTSTPEGYVRDVLADLDLGELYKVDMVPAHHRETECLRIFLHFRELTENGKSLYERLRANDEAQREHREFVPVRIVHCQRKGRDLYWMVYLAKTPAERETQMARNDKTFKSYIEM